jgi:hypothetical protein
MCNPPAMVPLVDFGLHPAFKAAIGAAVEATAAIGL